MKNGKYTLVTPPEDYPGKRYRGKYAYEHRVIFWQKNGYLPEIVHHDNDSKRDNAPDNLIGLTKPEHDAISEGETMVTLICGGCGQSFQRELRNAPWQKGAKMALCTRSCRPKKRYIGA